MSVLNGCDYRADAKTRIDADGQSVQDIIITWDCRIWALGARWILKPSDPMSMHFRAFFLSKLGVEVTDHHEAQTQKLTRLNSF